MTTKPEDMRQYRPGALDPSLGAESRTRVSREERLQVLRARWDQYAGEYEVVRRQNNQEVMTNLRGLMLLIKKEIVRLGGDSPEFPYPHEPHLADL